MANESQQDAKYLNNTITVGAMSVDTLTPTGIKDPYSLVKKIFRTKDRNVIFQFVAANYRTKVIVRTYEHGSVVYALTVADTVLLDVYPIAEMADWKMVGLEGRPVFEGRKIRDTVYWKHVIAERLDLTPEYTGNERKVLAVLEREWAEEARERRERFEAEQAAARAKAQAERDARAEARQKELSRILTRPILRGYSVEGLPLSGVPVVGNEWEKLRDGAWCVGVESYDDETKTPGAPTGEHFLVDKRGHATKARVRKFVMNVAKASGAERLGAELINVGGKLEEVGVYTPESLEHLKASGLNGGAIVGVREGDFLQLYRFNKKGYRPEGGLIKLSAGE